jgi:hypothetical protein
MGGSVRSKKKHQRGFKQRTTLHVDEKTREILERQRQAFRAKFGRDPGPNDPIFFDPDCDEPRSFDLDKDGAGKSAMLTAARRAGLRKETIDFIDQNYDKDALFECPDCETQMVGWALAHPICPDCG